MQVDDSDDVCWICLQSSSTVDGVSALVMPCACPRPVHDTCLARWQLHCAGREEEVKCRFCKQTLPHWRDAFGAKAADAEQVAPVMSIQFAGQTFWLNVQMGEGGLEVFKADVKRLLNLSSEDEFDITFECLVPGEGSRLELHGLEAYDAAVYCASLTAAERMGRSAAAEVATAAAAPADANNHDQDPAAATTTTAGERPCLAPAQGEQHGTAPGTSTASSSSGNRGAGSNVAGDASSDYGSSDGGSGSSSGGSSSGSRRRARSHSSPGPPGTTADFMRSHRARNSSSSSSSGSRQNDNGTNAGSNSINGLAGGGADSSTANAEPTTMQQALPAAAHAANQLPAQQHSQRPLQQPGSLSDAGSSSGSSSSSGQRLSSWLASAAGTAVRWVTGGAGGGGQSEERTTQPM